MDLYLSTIASLKSSIPETSWSWVIPALKHDQVIWESLHDQEFFEKVAKTLTEPIDWSPHQLAAIRLGSDDLNSLDKSSLKDAQASLDEFIGIEGKSQQEQLSLKQAALISAGLLNRYGEDLQILFEETIGDATETSRWNTVFAILIGLISDQLEWLTVFVSRSPQNSLISLAVHAFLCQPIPFEEQKQHLKTLLANLPLQVTSSILNSLSDFRPELTLYLANEWLINQPRVPTIGTAASKGENFSELTALLHYADICSLARQMEKAESLKAQSLNTINTLQAQITNELVANSLTTRNIEHSLSDWTSISNPPKLTPPSSLIVKLLQSDRMEDSIAILPEMESSSQTPIRWLINIYQALKNEDIAQARLFAHQALNSFLEHYESKSDSLEQIFGSQQDLIACLLELIQQLTNLASYKEAYQAASIALQIYPNDPEILIIVTKTGRAAGAYDKSIEAAELATAIDPTNPEYRRQLAQSLESADHWIVALKERQSIIEHRFAPPSAPSWPIADDLLDLANCSINAEQPQQALDICQKAIELDPSNGQAHALLGEALTSLGEIDQALEHFDLATQLSPHKAAPWLSLANAYQRAGQIDKTIETLRTASHAVPEDPSLFYSLGKVYIEEASPSQAQSALARAYQLVTEPATHQSQSKSPKDGKKNLESINRNREQLCQIALSYGKVLETLGHPEEANQVYEKAYQAHPSFPGLAYIYAKSIMESGDEKTALAPLAIAVAADPTEPQPYIEYARALLLVRENPSEAVRSLEKALEMLQNLEINTGKDYSEEKELATALLAQAQEASGEMQDALLTYSQALESELGKGELWKTDLAIGMGRVALQLNQPEVAIAALQVSDRDEIQNPEVAQILCEAYSAISLTQEALFAARTAVHLAPDDIEILSWFASQADDLGIIAEAIPALTRGVQLAPKRTDLIIRLGQVLARMGKEEEAKEAFLSALTSPYSTPEDLYKAADGLSDLGDEESAADCLERALELQPHPPIDLILELAHVYSAASKTELAIKTIDKGIDQDPENALLHTYKAGLLSELDRQDAAQACLEHALILEPENPLVHLQIGYVLRDQGDFIKALEHANFASGAFSSIDYALTANGLAAELARSNLHDNSILKSLESPSLEHSSVEIQHQSNLGEPSLFDYYCISAENALEKEEQIAAAAALNDAFLIDSEHPRVLALQSRMALRQGDRESALTSLKEAIDLTKDPDREDIIDGIQPNSLLGIAFSAIELYQWDLAKEILDSAVSISPKDAFIRLQRTRLFVERAEFQRLCLALDIVNHAPGATALSPRTYRIIEESIEETSKCLPEDLQAEQPSLIRRWQVRGEVAFHPDTQTIGTLEIANLEASDLAALLLAISQSGDSSATAQLYHSIQSKAESDTLHHCIYAAYALALCSTGQDQIAFEQAKEAIQSALNQNQTEAIYYVIQAKVAEKLGEWHIALAAMETALSLWSNEPRWQSYLGQISQLNEDFPEAISHYKNAIEMEPRYLQHYFDLSQAHIANGQAGEAISVLRQSLRFAPDQVEPYLALANAQYENQDYTQALKNAQMASKIAPDELSPLITSGKIAIKMEDPGKAKTYAESALRIEPDSPEALHLQAQALSAAGQAERALNIVEKAIPLSSNPLPLLLQRARLLSQSEGSEANLEALQSIAEEYPDEPLVLAPLAEAFSKSGKNPEAIQSAQQALRRSSGEIPLDEQANLHNLLGSLLQQSGQLDQSIHHLSEAIRIAPSSLDSYLTLGSTQAERRQYDQALETYQKAIRIHPSDPRPYHEAGQLLKASRDYPAAEKMLRRAAEKAPDDVAIHRQLAALVALNLVHNRQPISSEV
jgi:tetratricopeptide (TPR) repeat protein